LGNLQKNFEAASNKLSSTSKQSQSHTSFSPSMSEQEITSFQQKWEQLSEWGTQNPEEWGKNEIENNERLLEGIEAYVLPFFFFPIHHLHPSILHIQQTG